jgi:DNA-binding FadR family transcriptional regulator
MTNPKLVRISRGLSIRERLLEIVEFAEREENRRLPTERKLTELLGISRGPLRTLLAELEADGLIWRHVGRGTFAGPRPTSADVNLKLVCEHSSPSELLEARIVVEPQLAALAAVRASATEISELSQMGRKCASAADYDIYEKWDESLHRAIALASRNRTLVALFNGLNAVRKEIVWGRIRPQRKRMERRQQHIFSEQHMVIVRAIGSRDADAARQAMRQHLESFSNLYHSIEPEV